MSSSTSEHSKKNSATDIELTKFHNHSEIAKENKDEQKNSVAGVAADCTSSARNGTAISTNASHNNSYSKFTGATSISHLLTMSYSDSTQMSPDLNSSFPHTQTKEEQMKDEKYKFSNAKQGRRNSPIYEKNSQIRQTNARGLSLQKTSSVGDKPEQRPRSTTNDSFDCNLFFLVLREIGSLSSNESY